MGLSGGEEPEHPRQSTRGLRLPPGERCHRPRQPPPTSGRAMEEAVGDGAAPEDRHHRAGGQEGPEGDPRLPARADTTIATIPNTIPRTKPVRKATKVWPQAQPPGGEADHPGQAHVPEAHAPGDEPDGEEGHEGRRPGDDGAGQTVPPVVDRGGGHQQRHDQRPARRREPAGDEAVGEVGRPTPATSMARTRSRRRAPRRRRSRPRRRRGPRRLTTPSRRGRQGCRRPGSERPAPSLEPGIGHGTSPRPRSGVARDGQRHQGRSRPDDARPAARRRSRAHRRGGSPAHRADRP